MRRFWAFLICVVALGWCSGLAQGFEEPMVLERQTIFETVDAAGETVRFECVCDTAGSYFAESNGFSGDFVLLRNGVPVPFINTDIDIDEGEVDASEEEEEAEVNEETEEEDDNDNGIGESWLFDESRWSLVTPMYYFPSPDGRFLFVTHKPSLAGSCDILFKIHLYRIDCATGEVAWLTNCGGLALEDDGFRVLRQVEWLNPDACCAEARFSACEGYYDYAGERVRRGPVELLEAFVDRYDLWYGDDIGENEAFARLITGQSIASF